MIPLISPASYSCVGKLYSLIILGQKYQATLAVMTEYHKIDTNEYLNIFGYHIMYQMNI